MSFDIYKFGNKSLSDYHDEIEDLLMRLSNDMSIPEEQLMYEVYSSLNEARALLRLADVSITKLK